MKNIIVFIGLILSLGASAQQIIPDQLYKGDSLEIVSAGEVAESLSPGTILIVSEFHDLVPHHEKQVLMLQELKKMGHRISVGMEFFTYTEQSYVDQFLSGQVTESDFLKLIGWGGNDFNNYRTQVLFPVENGGTTIALNAPRVVSNKVARKGLNSLTEEEKALLPPDFQLGNQNYYERFKEIMKGHVPHESMIVNFFAAQSIWDDTMAWRATEYMRNHPEQILVIIVGDFHNIYGGGLPDRIRARGHHQIVTITQTDLAGMTQEEIFEDVAPHARWGVRSDFVWTSLRK